MNSNIRKGKNIMLKNNFLLIVAVLTMIGCSGNSNQKKVSETPRKIVSVPKFNADSAYAQVKRQVDFGPRIPNTKQHIAAGEDIIKQLESFGAIVTIQEFESTTYDGVKLKLKNIIATFSPNRNKRILLAAHWDTRPWASKDMVDKKAQFDGANDGASGVGVLLEIARVLGQNPKPEVGVDMIFFDGEDWGQENGGNPNTWCLGSQYWSKNKHKANYSAYYGILLDMVGAKGAQFPWEGLSYKMAKGTLQKVWKEAAYLGHGQYFVNQRQSEIMDDHFYVNTLAKIPMIDILHHDPVNGYFGSSHHTQNDNMSIIDKNTLKAVGETVLSVLYYE